MPTRIDYWGHDKGAEHMRQFFPTATEKDLPGGLGWSIEYIQLTTHSGTHLDAPWHYHPTMNQGEPARTIDHIPLEWCFSDGVKLDFSKVPGEGGKITVEILSGTGAHRLYVKTVRHRCDPHWRYEALGHDCVYQRRLRHDP